MAVKIVTDSTADLLPAIAAELDIAVVPLTVYFGEEVLRDGVDITAAEFLARLTTGSIHPRTSQPSPEAFKEVYSSLLAAGHQVVSIHVAAKLSGTMNSALVARQALQAEDKITVIDSTWATMTLGLVAINAAKAARAGKSVQEIVLVSRDVMANLHLIFFCDTLEYLQRGGRIGRAQAFVGGLLNIKPILSLWDAEIHPVERVRTRSRALERLRELAVSFGPVKEFCVLHSGSPQDARSLFDFLGQRYPDATAYFGDLGPVITTHVGPGVVGFGMRSG